MIVIAMFYLGVVFLKAKLYIFHWGKVQWNSTCDELQ